MKKKDSKKLAEAKKIALTMQRRRHQLAALMRKADLKGGLKAEELVQVKALAAKICSAKASIELLGFDVKMAATWAHGEIFAAGKKKKRGAKRVSRKNTNGSGVGMYGLGNSIKAWK